MSDCCEDKPFDSVSPMYRGALIAVMFFIWMTAGLGELQSEQTHQAAPGTSL